jgi:hypothetical protein
VRTKRDSFFHRLPALVTRLFHRRTRRAFPESIARSGSEAQPRRSLEV